MWQGLLCTHIHGCAHVRASPCRRAEPCSPEQEEHGRVSHHQLLHRRCLPGCPFSGHPTAIYREPAAPAPGFRGEGQENHLPVPRLGRKSYLWTQLLHREGSPGLTSPHTSAQARSGLCPKTPVQIQTEVSSASQSEHAWPAPGLPSGAPAGSRRGRAGRAARRRAPPSRGALRRGGRPAAGR